MDVTPFGCTHNYTRIDQLSLDENNNNHTSNINFKWDPGRLVEDEIIYLYNDVGSHMKKTN